MARERERLTGTAPGASRERTNEAGRQQQQSDLPAGETVPLAGENEPASTYAYDHTASARQNNHKDRIADDPQELRRQTLAGGEHRVPQSPINQGDKEDVASRMLVRSRRGVRIAGATGEQQQKLGIDPS